ncbi:MAG: hypothetical protein M1816_002937 [Peltula sp. TS41687]|nr:MAG: hypothetical protein M1816_002937 [Peltula sp. TS41687]
MPSISSQKRQPWKAHWPPKAAASSVSFKDDTERKGTQHGFAKGETVILDGNTVGKPHSGQSRDEPEVKYM